ncbi:dethiobiotin synthase [Marilutibacter chinensis]|uniref:ATP-dependent dethiobiotin synthetase BioD n=1 Tax=Marilutibacter chinensis TaxID=2912247 RepID=A0ABS9HTW1_9GAMM|nr:dethiobiotin synthase [Lysobacter chinensis]MCF7222325.1 dethiobiotin synthase [Lysobacter chinensis]
MPEPAAVVRAPGLFVTGTDTGIGKSVASACLLHALRAQGLRASGMKPVASGCERTAEGWRNEDALLLQAASDPVPTYDDVNPYALPAPLAPELAATDAGVELELEPLLAAFGRLSRRADLVVVEGVGGWAAPLSATLDQADLVRALGAGAAVAMQETPQPERLAGLPVVLVVGLRLGCINHARLSARAIAADGLHLAGWIANGIDPDMQRADDNFRLLHARLPAPCLGRIPHLDDLGSLAAVALDVSPLLPST